MKKIILLASIGFFLAGCAAVPKEMIPVGGSKADGTVRMGYAYGAFEKPIVDLEQAKILAGQKCKIWGYDGAEPFGGQQSSCGQTDGFGNCNLTNVTVEYQCIDGKVSKN